jgi:hypothetical protein
MSAEIYMDSFLSQMLHFGLCVLGIVVSIEVPKIAVIFSINFGVFGIYSRCKNGTNVELLKLVDENLAVT